MQNLASQRGQTFHNPGNCASKLDLCQQTLDSSATTGYKEGILLACLGHGHSLTKRKAALVAVNHQRCFIYCRRICSSFGVWLSAST